MTAAPSKIYSDDVSLVVILLDVNPLFWSSGAAGGNHPTPTLSFAKLLNDVISFLNSILLMNQLNQVVVIASGVNSCGYIYDSGSEGGRDVSEVQLAVRCGLDEFLERDGKVWKESEKVVRSGLSSLLSGSLSLALCYIQRVFRSGTIHPQPRILCLQATPDGPEQYVAVMNAIFSAQRSMVPIDSCVVGVQHSAFLQQASYITGGIYLKPIQLDALFQYLIMVVLLMHLLQLQCLTVFATDLQSRNFLRLPKPAGVDFRASCFCHKKTIDMGYVCSVCLSIFCKYHKKCSTCGSEFNRPPPEPNSASGGR